MKPEEMPPIEVVLAAHNEAASIGGTLREFYEVTSAQGFRISFRVTEDGSSDGTPDVVRSLAQELPVALLTAPERKGYSRAVIDGLKSTTAEVVGFIDGDGQCDPHDLVTLAAAFDDADLVLGFRNPRADPWFRKAMSRAFGLLFKRMFPVRLRDPSCPYLLIRKDALTKVLRGAPGILPQGFWWEFNARANAAGLRVREVPVHHRVRSAGQTQVYRPNKMPKIVGDHVSGLWKLRRDIAAASR
jgi:glycosyltransferase involved in cell wall biosynthesis